MKAWRIEKHGGPEVLERKEVPDLKPGPMQARVRVEAVGLNHLDLWVRNGVPGHKFPLPITPGCDIAGVVEELGAVDDSTLGSLKAQGLGPGASVIVNPGTSCGRCEACLGGNDPLCPHYGILGETRDGGCADFINVPLANLIQRPANLTAIQAAGLPIPFLTAWTMLMRKTLIKPGETALIQAGGSGVSMAAIQIAKMAGAQVITTVGSDEKIAHAKSLGADHVINYKKSAFRDEVRKILSAQGKKGVEVAIEHVGADTFTDTLKCLAWGGRLATCGATAGSEVKIDLKLIFFKNISILGTTMGSKADLIRIVQLTSHGKLKPLIDSTLSMAKYPEACTRLESRLAFGRVVVTH